MKCFTSVVYSESGLKVEHSSRTTDAINGTILVAAANKKTASISTLEIYYVTGSLAGSAVLTKDSEAVVKRALRRFATKPLQQYATLFIIRLYSTGKDSISELFVSLPFESTGTETVDEWILWNCHSLPQ